MRTRITHIITGLEVGGAERQLTQLVTSLALRRDFDQQVISMTGPGVYGADLAAAGIPVVSLGMARGLPSPAGVWRLLAALRRHRPALIQTWMYHADLIGLIAAACLHPRPPVLWNLRCSDLDPTRYSRLSRLTIAAGGRLSRLPAGVIHNAQAGRRAHEALGYQPRQWFYLPNAFDLERFQPDPDARDWLRGALGLGLDVPLIGHIARFDPMKDQPGFLRAAALVARKHSSACFVMAGSGIDDQNETLMQEIRAGGLDGRVFLLGRRSDIPQIMAGLDIAVSSSAFGEGFANVLGEALACAVPAVATDVGDSAAIVGAAGRVVPPANPQALAAALLDLLGQPGTIRRQLGQHGRLVMEQTYRLDKIAADYAAVWRQVIGG